MKTLLQLEELAEFLFSIYLFSHLPFAWWIYPLLFFTPDLSLVALVAGQRFGEQVYNMIHHKGLALGLFVVGTAFTIHSFALAGLILLGHASFDRLLGLGFKEGNTFTHSHLKLLNLNILQTR